MAKKVSESGQETHNNQEDLPLSVFFPGGATSHTKKSPNQNLITPTVEAQNGPLKPPPTYLGLKVHNLHILQVVDLPGMSTNSIMPFHNHASILVH